MAKRLIDMTLEELYNREKITPATIKAIHQKEDFSSIKSHYCEKVCDVPCYMKEHEQINLKRQQAGIVFLHAHRPMDNLFKSGRSLEAKYRSILSHIVTEGVNRLNLDPSSRRVRWTEVNALKCTPIPSNLEEREKAPWGEKPMPKNPNLTITKIQKCAVYAKNEITFIKPRVIISTSTEATKALGLKDLSNYNNRGEVHPVEINGHRCLLLLTLHPSVITMIRQNASGRMWGADMYSVIRHDIIKALELSSGLTRLPTLKEARNRIHENEQIYVTRSIEEVQYWFHIMKDLPSNQIVSWDIEATGLDPWAEDARMLCHQFGYKREDGEIQAIVIPLWHKDNTFYDPDEAWRYVKNLLEDEKIKKVAHNASFDLKYTKVTTGVEVKGLVFDTMLLLHAMNSGVSGNYSLKTACWDLLYHRGYGGYEGGLEQALENAQLPESEKEKPEEKEQKQKPSDTFQSPFQ